MIAYLVVTHQAIPFLSATNATPVATKFYTFYALIFQVNNFFAFTVKVLEK
jgi:hypothetical protein